MAKKKPRHCTCSSHRSAHASSVAPGIVSRTALAAKAVENRDGVEPWLAAKAVIPMCTSSYPLGIAFSTCVVRISSQPHGEGVCREGEKYEKLVTEYWWRRETNKSHIAKQSGSHAHTLTHTHTLIHTHTHSFIRTHTRTLSHPLTLSHTHTHRLSLAGPHLLCVGNRDAGCRKAGEAAEVVEQTALCNIVVEPMEEAQA